MLCFVALKLAPIIVLAVISGVCFNECDTSALFVFKVALPLEAARESIQSAID